MKLTDREWKPFVLGKIFEIEPCKCSKISGIKYGQMPYVGATNRNNGVLSFVIPESSLITKGNCIAFICDGEGSIGYSIYKNEDFIGSTTVKVGRNKNLNRYTGTFITTIADTVRSKYNFGFKRNENHLKKETLLLPINIKGEPDFVFMESFMRQKETELLVGYKNHLSILKPNIKVNSKVEWKEFLIGDIFKIYSTSSSIDKVKLTGKSGLYPYITRTDKNNGYDSFVDEQPKYSTDKGNVITIGLDTQTVFYQKIEFYTGQNIQILEFDEINEHNAQFIITLLKIQMKKFNWGGNGATLTRLKKTKILLPKTSDDKPDFVYMENYMKALEYEKLKQYLDYKELNTN